MVTRQASSTQNKRLKAREKKFAQRKTAKFQARENRAAHKRAVKYQIKDQKRLAREMNTQFPGAGTMPPGLPQHPTYPPQNQYGQYSQYPRAPLSRYTARPVDIPYAIRTGVGHAVLATFRAIWNYRWTLTPIIMTLAVFAMSESGHALRAIIYMALIWAGIELQWMYCKPDARVYLSRTERDYAASWLCWASVWCVPMLLPWRFVWWVNLAALCGVTGKYSHYWIMSRNGKHSNSDLSQAASELAMQWHLLVTMTEEKNLAGSRVIPDTLREPGVGTIAFTVQLRDGIHAEDATSDASRKFVEVQLHLPVNCVQLMKDSGKGSNASLMLVVISKEQHLSTSPVKWPGPEMIDEMIPIAETPGGKIVSIPHHDKDGVKHARISGNSGAGKTSTARVILSAKISCANEVIFHIDGKGGTSLPEMRNTFDWCAIRREEWAIVINTLYIIMLYRELKRGELGLSAYRFGHESDSVITLEIEEASAVIRYFRSIRDRVSEGKVLEILQKGRALGICVIQSNQSARGELWLGGVDARELMAQGAAIAHRPGGRMGKFTASDGADAEDANALKLPPEPGFAVITVNGQTEAPVARTRYADDESIIEWAATVIPQTLTADEAFIAGEAYANRTRFTAAAGQHECDETETSNESDYEVKIDITVDGVNPIKHPMKAITAARARKRTASEQKSESETSEPWGPTSNSAAEELTVTDWIIEKLELNQNGLTLEELAKLGKGTSGRGRTKLFSTLQQLEQDGLVTRVTTEGITRRVTRWVLLK